MMTFRLNEMWKDIAGYEGLYQISNLGRVRFLDKEKLTKNGTTYLQKGGIKSNYTTVHGYLRTSLTNEFGQLKNCVIHRLVAIAFIPNANNLKEVNHIDGNKENNCVENLEWCTSSQNKHHACKTGLNNGKLGHTGAVNKLSKKVAQYDKFGNFIKVWDGLREAERNGFDSSLIWMAATGKNKTHKGFIWKYVNEK